MSKLFNKHYFVFISLLFVASCFAYALFSSAGANDDIIISSNTTWVAGTYTYRDITITNNAILTLGGTYSSDTDGTGVIINARSITVDSGARISADATGYAGNAGTGKGNGSFGSGAGYGGVGAVGGTGNAGGVTYGSPIAPLDLGSGGGNAGGAGGGAIKLSLSGNLSLAGSITANAGAGGFWKGGGSGGSVYIIANDMSGSGTISTTGGNGGNSSGSGGGGRVALYYNGTNTLTPANITASGGTGGTGAGASGTVFWFDKGHKDLNVSSNITLTPSLGIDSAGDPTTNGIFKLRNLTVTNNASLFVGSTYTTDSDGSGVDFQLSGDLTVDSGSTVDAKGLGYAKNTGEGKGTMNGGSNYGGGGAHGGNGGRGEVGVGGTKYDSTLFPIKLGSGGVTDRGAAGGGIIKVSADHIIVNGSLDASASNPTANGAVNGSGGAGGTIYLDTSTVTGTGTIIANGSNGTGWSGGGGGGRIAIYADSSAFNPDNITAAKGVKGGDGASVDGSVGTVFLYNIVTGNVTASSDVTFEATQGVGRNGKARTDGVFYFNSLTVTNNSTVTIGATYSNDTNGRGVTINLDGNLTIDAGSTITATGQGYAGANGPGKGTGTSSTSGSGASYGGVGGKSYNNNLAPAVYGEEQSNFPYLLGSGGGNGDGGVGGRGGGSVTIKAAGTITNNGEISSNGAVGTGGFSAWRPGGGSGGSIFLVADDLTGSGNIWAKGGDAAGDANFGSGGGGGGRISIAYIKTQTFPLANLSTVGGTGSSSPTRDGSEGTVSIAKRKRPEHNFKLKNPHNKSDKYTNTENVEVVPDDTTVQKYKDAASTTEYVPTFYSTGWEPISNGKNVGAAEGEKIVRAWLKDENELIASEVGTATIIVDITNPELTIENNNTTVNSKDAKIKIKVNDNLSGVDYITVNGQRRELSDLQLAQADHSPSKIRAYAAEVIYEVTAEVSSGSSVVEIGTYDRAGNVTFANFNVTNTATSVSSAESTSTGSSTLEPATTATDASQKSKENTEKKIKTIGRTLKAVLYAVGTGAVIAWIVIYFLIYRKPKRSKKN